MKILIAALFVLMAISAQAQSVGAQDIEPMLQQMQAAGKISQKEMDATRKYMEKMKPEDWRAIQRKAEDAVERHPAAAQRVSEEGVDALNGADFNIQSP